MRILFVNPPSPLPGYGPYREECCLGLRKKELVLPSMLALLAGIARQKHQVEMIDLAAGGSIENLDLEKDLVVINVSTWLIRNDLETTRRIKEINPDVKIAVVVQPAEFEEWIYERYPIDYFVGSPRIEEFMKLVKVSKDAPSALDLLDLRRYHVTPIYSGLNCPYQCIFCAWGRTNHTYRDQEIVLEESRKVWDESPVESIYYLDPNMPSNPDWARSFASRINNEFKWHIDARVDRRDRGLLRTLRENGCTTITYGAETVGPGLSKLKKRTEEEWIWEAVANAKREGIEVHLPFIFGFPWDGIETRDRLIRFIQSLPLDDEDHYNAHPPFPFVSTELYQMVRDRIVYKDIIEMYEAQIPVVVPTFPTDTLSVEQVAQSCRQITQQSRPVTFYLRHPKMKYMRKFPRYVSDKLRLGRA